MNVRDALDRLYYCITFNEKPTRQELIGIAAAFEALLPDNHNRLCHENKTILIRDDPKQRPLRLL